MSSVFTISVPFDPRYRSLAGQVAGKYVEAIGGSAGDADGLIAAVSRAVDALATESGADADVALKFSHETGGVAVELRCGARSSVVKHVMASVKR